MPHVRARVQTLVEGVVVVRIKQLCTDVRAATMLGREHN